MLRSDWSSSIYIVLRYLQPTSWARAAAAGARNFSFRVHGRNTDAKHSSSQQVVGLNCNSQLEKLFEFVLNILLVINTVFDN